MSRKYFLPLFSVFVLACLASVTTVAHAAEQVAYIEIYYGSEKFIYVDNFIEPSDHLVAQQIFDRKINAPLSEKMDFVTAKLRGGADYKSALLCCFPLLERTVIEAKAALNRSPVNSEIRFDPSQKPMFTITKEREGLEVIEDRLYMNIYFALMTSGSVRVQVPVRKPQAEVKTKDNIALTKLRATYSTNFSQSTSERKHNIALALSKINGSVIGGGCELSFNQTVGRRTVQNGFKEAKIIKGGKYVPGIGGGVCQASTTLYNAALISDLQIVSVSRHTLKSSYELPSFDAMVNSGSSDLVIRNGGDKPVFVRAFVDDDNAYVQIFGSALPYKIKRKSEITFTGETPGYDEEVDYEHKHFGCDEESGARKVISYAHPEIHSCGYLLYYDSGGNLLEKKLIRTDVYSATRGTIAIAP